MTSPLRVTVCCACAQAIFRTLERGGRLAEHENQQLYSEAAGKFLADRFVSGTCPYCAYEVIPSWRPTRE